LFFLSRVTRHCLKSRFQGHYGLWLDGDTGFTPQFIVASFRTYARKSNVAAPAAPAPGWLDDERIPF